MTVETDLDDLSERSHDVTRVHGRRQIGHLGGEEVLQLPRLPQALLGRVRPLVAALERHLLLQHVHDVLLDGRVEADHGDVLVVLVRQVLVVGEVVVERHEDRLHRRRGPVEPAAREDVVEVRVEVDERLLEQDVGGVVPQVLRERERKQINESTRKETFSTVQQSQHCLSSQHFQLLSN